MNNIAIKKNIVQELEYDPEIDAAHIGVIVDNGLVTLTGRVKSFAEASRAQELARHVNGVRAIAQEIEVVHSDPNQPTDEELAAGILKLIHANSVIPDDQVQFVVRKGCVTAKGQVEWLFQKNAVSDAIREVRGVTDYVNQITIAKPVSNSEMETDILALLTRRLGYEPVGIKAGFDSGTVTLTGTIDHNSERAFIRHAVLSVPGVNDVTDMLTCSTDELTK